LKHSPYYFLGFLCEVLGSVSEDDPELLEEDLLLVDDPELPEDLLLFLD
jgi:hypothetical protein